MTNQEIEDFNNARQYICCTTEFLVILDKKSLYVDGKFVRSKYAFLKTITDSVIHYTKTDNKIFFVKSHNGENF